MKKFLLLSAFLVAALSVALQSNNQFALGSGEASGDTTFGIRAQPGSDAIMRFTDGSVGSVILALLADNTFVIKNEKMSLIEINQKLQQIVMGISKFKTQSLQYYGDLLYQDKPQWRLTVNENFWQTPEGWAINSVSTCGGINMLGGYALTAGVENYKVFENLPTHSKLRIIATFHFIDAWTGETAYMKVNIGREHQMEYVWTERYDSTQATNAINICGSHFGEGKFSSPIDITIPHVETSVNITFGTTLDQDPQDESWGLSNLNLYVL